MTTTPTPEWWIVVWKDSTLGPMLATTPEGAYELAASVYGAENDVIRVVPAAERDQALARVAVLREAIKNGIECCEPSRVDGILSRAIHGEDQAAEALLTERDGLKAALANIKATKP